LPEPGLPVLAMMRYLPYRCKPRPNKRPASCCNNMFVQRGFDKSLAPAVNDK
jgi:hypothetical protein